MNYLRSQQKMTTCFSFDIWLQTDYFLCVTACFALRTGLITKFIWDKWNHRSLKIVMSTHETCLRSPLATFERLENHFKLVDFNLFVANYSRILLESFWAMFFVVVVVVVVVKRYTASLRILWNQKRCIDYRFLLRQI